MADIRLIDIALIEPNAGQIPGVNANPREITEDKFEKLKKSLQDNPEMMELRELLVYEHNGKFVCIGGNMRYLACQELGYDEVPCKVIPPTTSTDKINAYIIKDNASFGEWDWDMLANEWDENLLDNWGLDFPHYEENDTEKDSSKEKDLSDAIDVDYKLEVDCINEAEQEKLYNELINRGYECRVLTL